MSRTVPAPADLGIEVLRVPEGAPVELDLRTEAVMEGVLVTGTARAALEEPLLRDAVVLALPFQPLCQDDCPGLCAECGARLADDPDHTHGEPVDPRWAALATLTEPEQDD